MKSSELNYQRPQTRNQLAKMSFGAWVAWLRDEVGAWILPAADERSPVPFTPLFVSRNETDPGAALAYEVRMSCGGRTLSAATAASAVLSDWSLAHDGVEGAALLVRFATILRSEGLYDATRSLVREKLLLSQGARNKIGLAIVRAASDRFSHQQRQKIALQLGSQQLLTPVLSAWLTAIIVNNDDSNIPKKMLKYGQAFASETAHSEAYRHFVARLLEHRKIEKLRAKWMNVHSNEPSAEAEIREKLIDCLITFDVLPIEGGAETQKAVKGLIWRNFGSIKSDNSAEAMEQRMEGYLN